MLLRCAGGLTRNQNEAFNATMLNLLGLQYNYFTEKVIQSKDCKQEYDAASYDEKKKKTIKRRLIKKRKSKTAAKNIMAITISLKCFKFNYDFFPDSLLKITTKLLPRLS